MKKSLIVDVKEVKVEKQEEKVFAIIKITKSNGKIIRKKIEEVILREQHSLSYSPEIININKKQYILNFPLRCLFEKKDALFNKK